MTTGQSPGFAMATIRSYDEQGDLMRFLWVFPVFLVVASPASAVDVLATALLPPGEQRYGVATIEIPLDVPIPILEESPLSLIHI
mgnify:CR=1 FL=1